MTLRVGIFGFGKVGRNLFRAIYHRSDMEVVAINDIAEPEAMGYLLRFDSLYGCFEEPVQVIDGTLYAKGRRIPILNQREPGQAPWFEYGVDVVIDATGRYRTRAALQKHLDAGADRVILTTPPRDEIDAVYMQPLESAPIARHHRIISCGSSTACATAILLQVLDGAFRLESAFFTSIHAYTTEQSLIDVPSSVDLRLSRAAVENIVPVQSWTVEAMQRCFPKLRGKFGGCKLNVPVPDVSYVDVVATLEQEVRVKEVNAVFQSAANSTMKGILDYSEEPLVSTDVAGSTESCTFDSLATMLVAGNMVKVFGWYDQSAGHTFRIVDLLAQLVPKAA